MKQYKYTLKTIYIVYYIDNDGSKYLELITNDLQEWLKETKTQNLDNFKIEKTYLTQY